MELFVVFGATVVTVSVLRSLWSELLETFKHTTYIVHTYPYQGVEVITQRVID